MTFKKTTKRTGRSNYVGNKKKYSKPVIVKEVQSKLKGSEQQEAFWDALLNGSEHLILSALAGTGKTTTLIQGLLRMEEAGYTPKTALLAFNKSIAEELQRKVPSWAIAGTMHSLGYSVCRRFLGKCKVTGWKLDNLADSYFPEAETDDEFWMVKKASKSLVGLAKANLLGLEIVDGKTVKVNDPTMPELVELIVKHNIDTFNKDDEVVTTAIKLLRLSREKTYEIDFDDMLWLPIVKNWQLEQFELLMVDESQDLNRCQQETVRRMIWGDGRVAMVGDSNQAIYGFRGADSKSMKTMEERLESTERGVRVLPLTYTRRCPIAHVELAKNLVPTFENFPGSPEGSVVTTLLSQMVERGQDESVEPGDMMLCRMNAPLCLVAFRLLKADVPVKVQGKDFGGELVGLVLRLVEKDDSASLVKLEEELGKFQDRESAKLSKRRNPEMALEILEDKLTCIRLLGEGLDTVRELVQRIETLFAEVTPDGKDRRFVLLSSVHRAKGLEADRVFILQPWMMPHPKASTLEDQEQERNIQFVAFTRSKNVLVLERKPA